MRNLALIILLAVLGAAVLVGCEKDNLKPYFTRIRTSGQCGIAPFQVEFFATASGGDALEDPTDANLPLNITWDFDDDGASGTGSLAFHTFEEPGHYTVVATVEDEDGDTDMDTVHIEVRADTLSVTTFASVGGTPGDSVYTCNDFALNLQVDRCDFDPETGDYSRFVIKWTIDDAEDPGDRTVYIGRNPQHQFAMEDTGVHHIALKFEAPALSLTRLDTVTVDVVPSPSDLELVLEANTTTPAPGDTMRYLLTVTNHGPFDVIDLLLNHLLPDGMTRIDPPADAWEASQGVYGFLRGNWRVNDLLVGESATLELVTTVDPGTVGQEIVNEAHIVEWCGADVDPTNANPTWTITVQEP